LREDTPPVEIDPHFWAGRRVLVTGHTGFNGAWLTLWLQALGAEVTGLSRGLSHGPSLYQLANLSAHMQQLSVDLCDASAVHRAIRHARPQVILHLAAQPIATRSLRDPFTTYNVNVTGTVNLLDAVRQLPSDVQAVVIASSHTCYQSTPQRSQPFVEHDPLGGTDPYSSSKACVELIVSAYRRSFFHQPRTPNLATARVSNVLGGGDWGEDRLVPDAVRAVHSAHPLELRNPTAVRPWQHVLSPLSGYLRLAQQLAGRSGRDVARAWNFGPAASDSKPVSWIAQRLATLWHGQLTWQPEHPHHAPSQPQAAHPTLDCTAAEQLLGWHPACNLDQALQLVVDWHQAHKAGEDMRALSLAQIEQLSR
jgi:CDP-glucose 4,6-dehydratase